MTLDAATGTAVHTFTYGDDDSGPLTSVMDVDGNVLTVERDEDDVPTALVAPHGQRTELTVGADGWLTEARDPAQRATAMTYERDGLLSSFELPGGRVSTFGWDSLGRLTRDDNADAGFKTLTRTESESGFAVAVATRRGRTRSLRVSDTASGESVLTETDPAGIETTTTRTPGRTVSARAGGMRTTAELAPDPQFAGGGGGKNTLYPSTVEVRRPSGKTSRAIVSRTADLADSDDPLSVTRISQSMRIGSRVSTTTWDKATSTIKTTTPAGRTATTTLDAAGRVVAGTAPDVLPVSFTYDGRGRPTTLTQGGRVSTLAYDPSTGWLSSATDALGRTTAYDRDVLGRVSAVHLPGGRTIGYEYDAAGNLTEVVPDGRPAHTFAHTLTGLRAGWTPPLAASTGSTSYTYDHDQALASIVRPDGTTIDVDTDSAGRPRTLTHSGQTTTLGYHAVSGVPTSASNTAGYGVSWTYDGMLRTGEHATGPVEGQVVQDLDEEGRVLSSHLLGTPAVEYGFDSDDLLTRAGDLTLTRDPESGGVTGTALGSLTSAVTYDPYGNLASRTAKHDATTLLNEAVTRDAGGQVVTENETVAGSPARALEYVYDAAGRLDQVKDGGAVVADYGYDANGNRTSETVGGTTTTSTYDDQDRLLERGDVEYRYTVNGDLREKIDGTESTAYAYDAVGSLKTVDLPDARTIRYRVDPLGRRVAREVDGQRTAGWVYGEASHPSAEFNADGSIRTRFVYGSSPTVPEYMVRGGTTYRFVTDRLGSPRQIVNAATGAVAQELDYDAWGRVTKDTNPGFQPFGFTGGLYDHETGLVRLGARDYDPETGRWTTKDSIDFAGGDTNLYGYVLADPVNLVDPSGLLGISLQDISDAAAGFGDRASSAARDLTHMANPATRWLPIPTTADVREMLGSNDEVNACSWYYFGGARAADAVMAMMGGGARGAKTVEEGIYVIRGARETYVGQSGNVPGRLAQHVQSGRFTQAEADGAQRIGVSGGKTAREIAEQHKIDELGGIGNLGNKVNPIGPKRFDLMPDGYSRP